jgi:hypothetical protein
MSIIIRIRRGNSSQWASSTKVLQVGELGIDTTLNKIKAGNGSSLWPDLPWLTITPDEITTQVSGAVTTANLYTDTAITSLGNSISDPSNGYVPVGDVGQPDGVASLDANGKIPDSEIPDGIARDTEIITSYNNLTDKPAIVLGAVKWTANHYQLTGGENTRYLTGDIVWDGGNIYVANYDNESLPTTNTQYWSLVGAGNRLNIDGRDIPNILWENIGNKPTLFPGSYDDLTNKPTLFSGSYSDLTNKPTLFSGSYDDLTNKPTIPSLTGYATETYVNTAISNLVDSAPETLNTLNELAAALGDDANYATTISTALGNKLDSTTASSTYLTQANASSTYLTQANASSTYAPIASPTFTGTVGGITKLMVGLGNVDNTSDANKPVSTATQTALNAKLDSSGFTYGSITIPVYTATTDLPAASSNHGRWAHVHGEGAMYYAHGGSWYKALSQDDLYVTTNAQSSSYTLATSDLGKMIEMSGGGTLTITDSASFPVGFTVDVLQTGSSQVTVAGNGFTPNATPGLKLRTQWSSATLIKRGLNSWVVLGDLSA